MKQLTPQTATELLHEHMQNLNLRRHCYAVGKTLAGFYDYYQNNSRLTDNTLTRDDWEIVGILHDADWEETKDDANLHTVKLLSWLEDYEVKTEISNVFKSHNNKNTGLREPETLLEWTLECCDELTGFIVAYALMQPNKSVAEVTTNGVIKKFAKKEFARAVDREQISQCETKVQVDLKTFIDVTLKAMQENHDLLGL